MTTHKFPYKWYLSDTTFTKDKGKVFSCFACGGGSTMGYKLAGFDVIGCNEIDPRMLNVYIANHHPRFPFLGPIQEFKNREDLPDELFHLDILDESPPCSTFSIAGSREEAWGKKKKFREGQSEQVLDTLFFDFIDLAKRLQPKIVIAENVEGLIQGEARQYVRRIHTEFDETGYYCQRWLLNAADMGVPQKRKRVFFVCLRKDLADPFLIPDGLFDMKPELILQFREKHITFGEIKTTGCDRPLNDHYRKIWENRRDGDIDMSKAWGRMGNNPNAQFNYKYLYDHKVANTIPATDNCVLFDEPRYRNYDEIKMCGTFPMDYDFLDQKPEYICGMSVPPVMMAHIASGVYAQWLSKIQS